MSIIEQDKEYIDSIFSEKIYPYAHIYLIEEKELKGLYLLESENSDITCILIGHPNEEIKSVIFTREQLLCYDEQDYIKYTIEEAEENYPEFFI